MSDFSYARRLCDKNLPPDSFEFFETGFPTKKELAETAIVHIHADFSTQGRCMFRKIVDTLQNHKYGQPIKLYLLNGRSLSNDQYRDLENEFGSLTDLTTGGNGESFLIADGITKFVHGGFANQQPEQSLRDFEEAFESVFGSNT